MIYPWMRMLLAILLGNVLYFAAEPFLPAVLAHNLYEFDPGLVLDLAICAAVYLLLRPKSKPADAA